MLLSTKFTTSSCVAARLALFLDANTQILRTA
jgi:hypothetical protein